MSGDSFDKLIRKGERSLPPDAAVEDELLLRMLDRFAEPPVTDASPVDAIVVLEGRRESAPIGRRLPALALIAAAAALLVGGWIVVDPGYTDTADNNPTTSTTIAAPTTTIDPTIAITAACAEHYAQVVSLNRDLPGPEDGVSAEAGTWIETLGSAAQTLAAALDAHSDPELAAERAQLSTITETIDRQLTDIAQERTNRVPLVAPGLARQILEIYAAVELTGVSCTPNS